MQKIRTIFTLLALLTLILSGLLSCQLDNSMAKGDIIAENDQVKVALMENPEFKKAIDKIDAKIAAGELEIIPYNLSKSTPTGVTMTPAGSAFVLPGQSLTLKGVVDPTPLVHVYFWKLWKDGKHTGYADYTFDNTISVTIDKTKYGNGKYELVCTPYTGQSPSFILNSNIVSVTFTTWHKFTPSYSATFSSNTYNGQYTFNSLFFPNSGSGIITYKMTGGYQYKVSFSASSNGGRGIYYNGVYVTGGYGTNKASGSKWTSGNFSFNAGGTAGYQAKLDNLEFHRAY